MMARLQRLVRGQFPDQQETWRDYMQRDNPMPIVVLGMGAVALLMLVLAEAVDKGLA